MIDIADESRYLTAGQFYAKLTRQGDASFNKRDPKLADPPFWPPHLVGVRHVKVAQSDLHGRALTRPPPRMAWMLAPEDRRRRGPSSSSGSKHISDAATVRLTTVPSAAPPDLGRSAAHFLTSKPSLPSHLTLLLILIACQVAGRATGRAEARRRLGVLRCRRSERGPRRAPH